MCGIFGLLDIKGRPAGRPVLTRMNARPAHPGPGADGVYFDGPLGPGHPRLSIIALSEAGRQPLSNEDGSVWVTFNGEVYNFQELRPRLEALGHRFRTHTDTETIVHAYEEYGE